MLKRRTVIAATGAAMALNLLAAPLGVAWAQDKTIRIGWTAWSDAEAVTNLVAKILEDRLGYTVELVMADIGIQYQGIASGDLDAMLMSWQPVTHGAYLEQVGAQIDDLGPIYTMARLGWVVPNAIPEDQLASIEDLTKAEVREKLGGQIQGIDPGAGLMQASERAVEDYGLEGYELVSASDAGMLAALDRATRRDEWIVVTGWSPHWMFSKYDLRYIADPKGVLGGLETVNALARKEFYQEQPEAYDFLSRFYIDLDDLQAIMFEAQDSSYEEAVDNFISANPGLVDYWATGKIG
jgi:glycine betaine/proline transport system substrate-binding protein